MQRIPDPNAARQRVEGGPSPRALLFAGLALVSLLVSTTVSLVRAQEPEEPSPAKTVELVVDYGDGVQKRFDRLAWRSGMTVLDATQQAAEHPRGISFKYRGKQATAFLTEIDELKNQGGDGRNWVFRVNGELGKQSFALVAVTAGDTILWKFGQYR